jgi:ribose transport system substrate-binding protein
MRPSSLGSRALALIGVMLLVGACSSNASPTPSATAAASATAASSGSIVANKNYNIAMVDGQSTDPFFVTKAAGAKAEAQKLGATVNWQAPTSFDPSLQIPILDSVLASKPDFLIVHPTDKNALVATIKKFKDAGIPVITTGADLVDKTVRLGYIATDNIGGGALEATFLADALGAAGGKVILVTCPPGVPCGDDRKNGFEAELAKHPSLTYEGAQLYNGSDTTDAVRVVQAVLQRVPDLAGVAASDGSAGLGAATAINEAGKAGVIKVVTFDAGPDLVSALKKGWISALVIQQSYSIGATAVDFAVQYLNGGFTVPDTTRLAPITGTAANIDSPEIAKFLYAP